MSKLRRRRRWIAAERYADRVFGPPGTRHEDGRAWPSFTTRRWFLAGLPRRVGW